MHDLLVTGGIGWKCPSCLLSICHKRPYSFCLGSCFGDCFYHLYQELLSPHKRPSVEKTESTIQVDILHQYSRQQPISFNSTSIKMPQSDVHRQLSESLCDESFHLRLQTLCWRHKPFYQCPFKIHDQTFFKLLCLGLIDYAKAAATIHMIIHIRILGRKMVKKRKIGNSIPDGPVPPDMRW